MGPPSSIAPLVFPIGLAYIASAVKDDHELYCWDPNTSEDPTNEFSKLLEKTTPHVVGISLRNVDSALSSRARSYYSEFASMIKIIREKVPSCKIVVGGPGFSLFAKEIMQRSPEIDFGIILEGEQAFAQLLKNLEHPERVSNLVFRKNNQIHFTETQIVDFESLPPPSRDLFDLRGYRKKSHSMNVQTKRGCEFDCIFCPNNFLSGYSYRFRSPKSVVDEIEQLKNVYGFDSLRFVDSTFNYPFEYARKICQELAARKLEIDWTADFHAAYVNESFIREAVQSGCSAFNFSPDGASDRALAMLRKNMRVEHIKNTISLVKKVEGANASYSFMYDLPYYNSEHMIGLARLIPRMVVELGQKLYGIYMTRIRIYPYAPLYNLAVKEGFITKCTDILYPIYYSSSSSLSIENIAANLMAKFGLLFVITKRLKEG
jgi:radical SAM superfamily enzyme YgiQ (UPF0313 family)